MVISDQDTEARRPIGEMLVEANLITRNELREALERQKSGGGKLVENLIALNYLAPQDFLKFMSRQPGTASICLPNYTIPRDVIEMIPAEFAFKHELVPLGRMGRDLTVSMACPMDARSIRELEQMTGLRVRPLLVSINDIKAALNHYYGAKKAVALEMEVVSSPAQFGMQAMVAKAAPPKGPAPAESVPREDLAKAESGIRFEGVVHLVRKVHSLPALPETVTRVREAMDSQDVTTVDVARIIARDPSLSAKVISLANSPAYGFSHRVDSIELAATLLGLREINTVVLSSAVINYFDKGKQFDYKAFWKRSLFCGTAAKIVAKTCKRSHVSGVFAAGLLHDIGRAVFAEIAGDRYAVINQTLPEAEVLRRENEIFGIAHPELGYILADAWGMPREITEPIRFHHKMNEAGEAKDVVTIVALAALMTDAFGRVTRENVGELARSCQEALHLLGLSEKEFIGILGETAAAVKTELQAFA